MADETFWVATGMRLPGLGLLLLPVPPGPAWLAAPLHTAVRVQLHRPGQPPQSLPATIEEINRAGQAPAPALLLEADPGGEVAAGTRLTLLPLEFAFSS